MPISSLVFMLVFLPACILIYALLFPWRAAQNVVLLLASLVFYAFGQTIYVLVLVFSILWNYAMGLGIDAQKGKKRSGKVLAGVAVAVNVLLWLVFQLAEPLKAVFPSTQAAPWPFQLLMPLGLAWYTLQAVGYCLQVYRGEIKAERNLLYVGLYMAFFPKVTMGPLVDYSVMREQFSSRRHTAEKFGRGMCRFVVGLSKKLFLADRLSYPVNYIFTQAIMDDSITQLPVGLAWLGLLAFGLQLYYELSAYVDMAIGLGAIFGFDLPENFRYPFTATSLTDFWRRWNITPMAWFRKYVFGSLPEKENRDLVVRDLFVVWVLFALWAGGLLWTCLFWGVWNFLLLLAEYFFGYAEKIPRRFLRHGYTLLAVFVGFVLLRSDSLYFAGQYFSSLLGLANSGFWSDLLPVFLREYWVPLGFGVLFATPLASKWGALAHWGGFGKAVWAASNALYPLCIAGLMALCLVYILQGAAVNTAVF